ncbi:MAG: response regulator, partial [Bacteroidia bacterium]
MIKIILADDHSIIRNGLRAMLSSRNDIEIIEEAENGKEVLGLLRNKEADIVVMDINMPEMNGIETTRKITAEFPKVKVVCMSMHEETSIIKEMVEAGAMAYLFKDSKQEELLRAIDTVFAGRKYYNPEIFDLLLKTERDESSNTVVLTEREKEILKLICEEFTNPEIAEKLILSVRTIDTHRRNILQKLDVKNTAGLVKYAI